MNTEDRIWVAIDVPTVEEAGHLMEELIQAGIKQFKLGLELLSAVGRDELLEEVACSHKDCRIFWDGKFCDIPNTVGKASKVVSDRGVAMFNVHTSCGRKAIEAAVANKGNSKVLAVTLLTSLGMEDLQELGYLSNTNTNHLVEKMTRLAVSCGVDGIICSAQEASMVRVIMQKGIIMTPGIRPLWAVTGDQKRPTTPADAIKAGATDLVIGRPITNPPPEIGSPTEAIKLITEEIEQAYFDRL